MNPAVTANIPKLDMLCAVLSASPIIAYGICSLVSNSIVFKTYRVILQNKKV